MARKTVIDLDADQTVKFEKAGQEFEGHYIGSKKVKSDFGFSLLHVFSTEDGNTGVWGSAKLDAKLAQVPPGCKAFITYNGKVKIPGGKTMHKFDVGFDDEDTIDVGTVSLSFNNGQETEESEEGTETAQADEGAEAPEAESEDAGVNAELAAEEDDATEGQEEEEIAPAIKTKPAKAAPATAPTKKSADGVSNMLSKRPGAGKPATQVAKA